MQECCFPWWFFIVENRTSSCSCKIFLTCVGERRLFRGEPSEELHRTWKVTILNSKNEYFSCNVCSMQINLPTNRKLKQITDNWCSQPGALNVSEKLSTMVEIYSDNNFLTRATKAVAWSSEMKSTHTERALVFSCRCDQLSFSEITWRIFLASVFF